MPPKSPEKRSKKAGSGFPGLDPKLFEAIKKIPPNPIRKGRHTGHSENPNDAELNELVATIGRLDLNKPKVDLETYDYKALRSTIKHLSSWVIQLENTGFVDANGQPIEPDQAQNTSGVRPTFAIYCYDDKTAYRITSQCVGLPDSNFVLETLKRAIAEPTIPLKPCLPWFLLISIKLAPYVPVLKPFLDSLPAPFHWRVETREEAQGVNDGVHSLNEEGVRNGLVLAEKAKVVGNNAFSQKDRKAAVKAYGEALSWLLDVLAQKPDTADEEKAKKLQAVCYANRAAAYLIPGEGINLRKALQDGKDAEKADPGYAKAYVRQATANQLLGKKDDALDAIARALRCKDLENDTGLVDRFIELMTDGKGLSDDEATFKNWTLDVMINDRKSSERLSDIEGEWKRRCDQHLSKWKH
ncbi:unnamed protein product [Cyclocybe aegerita]|uniref:Uncharacterized protein n=1 Tax=Cyclocybe aegerita TaxID=1973307 RepID=A0A8S0WF64_CYCAE|nr:unnamed protein product [Cyclocybe aegerita]